MALRTTSLYQTDLAWIHHVGFGDFSREASPEVLKILKRSGVRSGTLVDLGCGSGIWAKEAARAGFNVIGVDASRAMIRLAKGIAPGVRFHWGSLHEFEIPRCDVITSLGEPLNYRGPGKAALGLGKLFRKFSAALSPRGMLIFDIMILPAPQFRQSWRAGRGWAIMAKATPQSVSKLLRTSVCFRKLRGTWRRSEEQHLIQLFDEKEVVDTLETAGFSVQTASKYGTMNLLPRRKAFIARRCP